jgi:uncharacterized membrane protein
VGALTLVSTPPTDVKQVYNDLATFGFSFLILITMWLRYTRIMSALPLESRRVVNLNILLLFCVSVEPFLFNLITRSPLVNPTPSALAAFGDATSKLYALDLGAMFAILGGFSLTLADEERKLIPKELTRQYRIEGATMFIFGVLFGVSALPIFYTITVDNGEPIRYFIWAIPLVVIWLRRAERGLTSKQASS